MKTKQEFIDAVALSVLPSYTVKASEYGYDGKSMAEAAYAYADFMWEERERRRKEDKKEWPMTTLYESFECEYPKEDLSKAYNGEYKDPHVSDIFQAYCTGFHNCNEMYAG